MARREGGSAPDPRSFTYPSLTAAVLWPLPKNAPLDAASKGGCRTVSFRGTEQRRPSTNVTGGVMVRLHKLFGVLQVDR